jgi:hypothetical protein
LSSSIASLHQVHYFTVPLENEWQGMRAEKHCVTDVCIYSQMREVVDHPSTDRPTDRRKYSLKCSRISRWGVIEADLYPR